MSSIQSHNGGSDDLCTNANRLAWLGRRILPTLIFLAAGIVLIVLIGIAQRLNWIMAPRSQVTAAVNSSAPTTFTCPMHPNIRQPNPGRCPICGMELVPAPSAATESLDELAVNIEPAQRRLANIQTAEVKAGPLEDSLKTLGAIAIDESRQSIISAYIDGRLERLFADYTGVSIKKGDHLAIIYSPPLYAAQVEYLEARRAFNTSGAVPSVRRSQDALVENTRHRLRELGMTEEQIAELERSDQAQSRLTIYSPQAGTVVEKLAIEGNYVKAGDPIYRVANLSTIWLMLKLFPEDAARIRFGQRVEATVQSLPTEAFAGRVAFVDPTVDANSRTVNVRVELSNEKGKLRPGDYAKATIKFPIGPQGSVYDADLAGKWISPMHPQIIRDEPGQCPICGMDLVSTSQYGYAHEPVPQPDSNYLPRSAVLLAGANSVVYVETKPGRFEIRPIKIGPILEDCIVVLEGVAPGERVATSGNFLIDSQMQLAGKPSLIDPTRAVAKYGRKGAPEPREVVVIAIEGETGQKLESLYAAYFAVQENLAGDRAPTLEAAQRLYETAKVLSQDNTLPREVRKHLEEAANHAEHIYHMDLAGARKSFTSISDLVLTLATQVRGSAARQSFTHFFCPMVPDGRGNWLQAGGELRNPYFGSEMLRCGEQIAVYSPNSVAATGDEAPKQHTQSAKANKEE